jgi:hypothetical protein
MKTFSIFTLFFGAVMAISQIAPVLGDIHRAEEAKQVRIVQAEKQDKEMVKRCSEGKTSTIMYRGKMCKQD